MGKERSLMNFKILNRKIHRWGSVVIAAPFLLVLLTGILLQLKKEIAWIQPKTMQGTKGPPSIAFDDMLRAAASIEQAKVANWDDIERLDVQPKKGVVKVQTKSRWEVQLDLTTAEVLQIAYRRSDLIESLHDGSWFHDAAKVYVFLPVAVIVLILWVTGLYLFVLPWSVRWNRQKKQNPRSGGYSWDHNPFQVWQFSPRKLSRDCTSGALANRSGCAKK